MGLLPVYALRSGFSAETGALFVTLFALGNVAFQFPVGYLADKVERGRLLILIALLSLAGAIVLAFSQAGGAFDALLLVWGGVAGSLYAVALGYLGARYAGAELASANAAFVMLYAAGMLGGPPITGAGMDALGPHKFFVAIAALIVCYIAVVFWARFSAKPAHARS